MWCVKQDYCEILSLSQVTYHVPVLFPDENLGLLTTKHHQLKYYSLDLDSTTTVMESPSETWHFHLVLTGKTAETDKQNIIFPQNYFSFPKLFLFPPQIWLLGSLCEYHISANQTTVPKLDLHNLRSVMKQQYIDNLQT